MEGVLILAAIRRQLMAVYLYLAALAVLALVVQYYRITKLEAANGVHEEKFRNLWHEIEDLKSGVSALHSGFEGLHELESRADEPEFPRPATSSEQEELPVVD
jgi:hypothetical protein